MVNFNLVKSLFRISCIVLIALGSNQAFTQSSLPWIEVFGNKFVTSSGEVMHFHGLNASDPDKLESDGMWTQSYFDAMKNWNANLVRFPVHPHAWRSRGKAEYMQLIDDGIKMAEQAGMYVVIDWHSIGNLQSGVFQHDRYFTTKGETLDFWKLMSERYGNNPTVAFFELFNEPTTASNKFGSATWSEWKRFMEEAILIVRANGAKNIPLVAGFDWAYELTEIKENPIDAAGIAYVSHPYPQKKHKPWEGQWEADWGYVSDTYPILLTEIGFCEEGVRGAHIPVINDGSYVKAITDYSHSKGISYIVWVFDPNWSPMLIEDWTFKPTKAGKVWKKSMEKYR